LQNWGIERTTVTFKTFIRVQFGKRLAALGGKAPAMKPVPRRRPGG
jgi:hypothetical protein